MSVSLEKGPAPSGDEAPGVDYDAMYKEAHPNAVGGAGDTEKAEHMAYGAKPEADSAANLRNAVKERQNERMRPTSQVDVVSAYLGAADDGMESAAKHDRKADAAADRVGKAYDELQKLTDPTTEAVVGKEKARSEVSGGISRNLQEIRTPTEKRDSELTYEEKQKAGWDRDAFGDFVAPGSPDASTATPKKKSFGARVRDRFRRK